jgi:hypothetical protein
MAKYVVLLTGDENVWERATPEEKAEIYGRHEEFSKALADRGHTVTGGAELGHSRTTKQVRRDTGGNVVVTDGPYAETAEQLGGFYLVETDDLDDLLKVCGLLADTEDGIEVREMLSEDSEA